MALPVSIFNKRKYFYATLLLLLTVFLASIWAIYNATTFENTRNNSILKPPICSQKSGFYTTDALIELRHENPQADIYFTTDGSIPNQQSLHYQKPFLLSELVYSQLFNEKISQKPTSPIWQKPTATNGTKSVNIRAVCYDKNKGFGSELTQFFFEGKNPFGTAPVVSLTVSPDDLFDYRTGIYVLGEQYFDKDFLTQDRLNMPQWAFYRLPANYKKRGSEWTKNANFEYLLNNKSLINQAVSIKIKGQATRALPQKTLVVNFLDKPIEGIPLFEKSALPTKTERFQTILLRNAGGESYVNFIREELFQSCGDGLMPYQAYQPVVVFLNGEYWGLHNMREHWTVQNIALRLGIGAKDVDFLEVKDSKILCSDTSVYREFEVFLTALLDTKIGAKKDTDFIQYIDKNIDLKQFTDYLIVYLFTVNTDFPNNNVRLYRTKKNRWQFILYDGDFAFGGSGHPNRHQTNMIDYLCGIESNIITNLMLHLFENDDFRTQFCNRYNELMAQNLSEKTLLNTLTRLSTPIRPLMKDHIDRWKNPASMAEWEENLEQMRVFIRLRKRFAALEIEQIKTLNFKIKKP